MHLFISTFRRLQISASIAKSITPLVGVAGYATKTATKVQPKASTAEASIVLPQKPTYASAIPSKWASIPHKQFLKLEPSAGKAPKQPRTSFAFYVSENGEQMKKLGRDGMKVLAQKFKELSDSEKKRIQSIVDKEKAAYTNSYSGWESKLTTEDKLLLAHQHFIRAKLNGRNAKLPVHPNKPKQPLNAYLLWVVENQKLRNQFGHLNPQEMASKMGEMWKALSEAEKRPYKAAALAESTRYKADMAKFNKSFT